MGLTFAQVRNFVGVGPPQPPPPLHNVPAHYQRREDATQDGDRDATTTDAVTTDVDAEKHAAQQATPQEKGVTGIQAARALWGKWGRVYIFAGLCLIMVVYELDNVTFGVYRNFAFSQFKATSQLGTVQVAGSIVFALTKLPLAKLVNVWGRAPTYCVAISFYLISYILMATAQGFNPYAAGSILHNVGQSGTNFLNDVIVADVTSIRWRAMAIGLLFWPFVIIPWVVAFMTESVMADGGIGWRWGIGMFGFIMPVAAFPIVGTIGYYQRKAKKENLIVKSKMTLKQFCSQIDLGGLIIFIAGLAMLLLPMTLAKTTPENWSTPWIIALIVVGGVFLIAFPFYEHYLSKYPIVPPHYFTNPTISMCLFLTVMDQIGFSATHTYLFSWAKVARGMSTRDATFYNYTNGVSQCLIAILAGWAIGKTHRYKWIAVLGSAIRLVGYAVMIMLRGSHNSMAELFIVQLIQGIGSAMMGAATLIPSQAVVPHSQMPQMTALNICFSFIGSSVGACVAGGIYTNTIEDSIRSRLGDSVTAERITFLANTIAGTGLPAWGSPERVAVSEAFSDVIRYTVYAAVGCSVPAFLATFFFTDFELPDRNNLVEE